MQVNSHVAELGCQEQKKGKKSNKKGILAHKNKVQKVDQEAAIQNILNGNLEISPQDLASISQAYLIQSLQNYNSEITLEALKRKKIKKIDLKSKNIQFSSMNLYAWLSNFFPTRVYDPIHHIIYPSVESGYVAFKARQAGYDKEDVVPYAHAIDPKQVKQMGKNLWERNSEEANKLAIDEMHRLVTLKFQQNPLIASWLCTAINVEFEEFTGDPFWGSAFGTIYNENSNHLGKIIQKVRDDFLPVKQAD